MDSAAKIVRCFQLAAADIGLIPPSDAEIRNIIGLALREAIAVLLPNAEAGARERLADRYRDHFVHLDETETVLFPGVEAGLQRLVDSGYQLAIATGKARRGLDRVLSETAIGAHFCVTRCADEAYSKPHPQMLHDILDYTGITPDRALMVGDTTYDLEMAAAAKMGGLAVSYGAHARERLLALAPLGCCDSFVEVCQWIKPGN